MANDQFTAVNDRIVSRVFDFVLGIASRDTIKARCDCLSGSDLSERLFRDYARREKAVVWSSAEKTAADLKGRSVFLHERALIFAKPSHNTMNMQVWLETIFGFDVVCAHDPAQFNEWLFRHAARADFLIVEQDSFADQNSFSRFMAKAREVADDTPLIVMGSCFKSNDFEPSWHDPWDISLRMPVSQTSCWLTVKAAANLTLNGRF